MDFLLLDMMREYQMSLKFLQMLILKLLILKILKKTESFGTQTDSFLNTLAFTSEKTEYSTGDLIIKSGEKSVKCLVILEGKAFIQKKTSPIELKAGAVVGLLSLINNTYPKDEFIAGTKGFSFLILCHRDWEITNEIHRLQYGDGKPSIG